MGKDDHVLPSPEDEEMSSRLRKQMDGLIITVASSSSRICSSCCEARLGASCWFLLSSTRHVSILQAEVGSCKLSITLIAVASNLE